MTDLLPVEQAVDALGDVPADEDTSAAIAGLSYSQIAEVVAAMDRRMALIVGRWLLEQRKRHNNDGSWVEALVGYAESFSRTPSTLRRWIADAAQHFGILHELPAQGRRHHPERNGSVAASVEGSAATPQGRLFNPETVDDVRQLGTAATGVPAKKWGEALTVAEIEGLIGVLRAARTEALRRAAVTIAPDAGHEHQWKKRQASYGGYIWYCTQPGCTETHLTKPESA